MQLLAKKQVFQTSVILNIKPYLLIANSNGITTGKSDSEKELKYNKANNFMSL